MEDNVLENLLNNLLQDRNLVGGQRKLGKLDVAAVNYNLQILCRATR